MYIFTYCFQVSVRAWSVPRGTANSPPLPPLPWVWLPRLRASSDTAQLCDFEQDCDDSAVQERATRILVRHTSTCELH